MDYGLSMDYGLNMDCGLSMDYDHIETWLGEHNSNLKNVFVIITQHNWLFLGERFLVF